MYAFKGVELEKLHLCTEGEAERSSAGRHASSPSVMFEVKYESAAEDRMNTV